MRITCIHLTNIRNYADEVIEPVGELNVFVGQNGQGKSAILEAVYMLATSKSHRTSRDSDMIRIGEDVARVSLEVEREERGDAILEITLARNEKKVVRVNKVKHDRVGDIVGQLNAVIFSSSDLDMVKGEPSYRRRFMNLEISQVSPQYVYGLGRYKRVLEQRNSVLRDRKLGRSNVGSLEEWDEQIVTYGSIMIEKRLTFLKRLSEIAEPIYDQLSGGTEKLEIKYEASIKVEEPKGQEDIKAVFRRDVLRSRDHDLARGTTNKGPHRDDIAFRVNGMDVRYFGSQGQQRSAALAVKLAEIGLVEEIVGESPVALLDDVGAELDEQRRSHVFEQTMGRCQTLVTATSVRELPDEVMSKATVFNVIAGKVNKE
jgi:DNA replication and repair protein RecF